MTGTNVPPITFNTGTGFVIPSGPAILAGVEADINAAFGNNLNFNLNTPQGQLASSTAALVQDADQVFLYFSQQVDPAFASGRFQDAIGRIYFLPREPPVPTALQLVCSGLTGVVIPLGALVNDTSGNIYAATGSATIGANGTVGSNFACTEVGPIPVPPTVSIYQAIPGWDSASVQSGVVGQFAESRSAYELRRQQSVAGNSFGAMGSIIGAVAQVPGVLDFFGYDNSTGSGASIGGVNVAAGSIYVCVSGGADSDVAFAIWSKKSPGAGYTGSTTVVVTDPNPLFVFPAPTYNVSFQRPTALSILFAVNIVNGPTVPANALALIQGAITQTFNGQDGGQRARINSTILATQFVSNIVALGPWVQIRTLQIGSNNTASAVFTGSIGGTTLHVSSVLSGAIAIGQTLSGTVGGTGAISVGTTVVSGSGVTWTITPSQINGTQTITAAVAASSSVVVQANQEPTLNVNNIILTAT